MWRRPSARTVASCLGDRPMSERVSVTLSLLSATDRLLHQRAVATPPRRVQVLQALDPAQGVERRLEHVVRVIRSERLREDVLHARRLEDRPHGAPGDDARARHRRLEEDAPGAEVSGDLARDRRVLQRHEDQILLGVLHRLADRLGHLVGLAEADTHMAPTVADHHQRREREAAAALDDLGHAVDGDDAVIQFEHARIDLRFCHYISLWRGGLRPPLDSPANSRERGAAPLSTPLRTRGSVGPPPSRLPCELAGAWGRPPLDSPANSRERGAAPLSTPLRTRGSVGPPPLSTPPRTCGAWGRPHSLPREHVGRRWLENQAAGARCVGERLHASVVHIAPAIEYHALDPLRLRLLGQELSNELGGDDVAPGR